MASTREIIERYGNFGSKNYAPFEVVLVKGEGAWCWDPEGKKYLDLLGGYSALNHGHKHPRILKVAHEQLEKISVVARCLYNEPLSVFVETMCKATTLERVMPMNSGAEAVESAIKVARAWGYRVKGVPAGTAHIVVCANNFHGRTTTVSGFSSEPNYRDQFAPGTPGFTSIPFGDADALEAAIGPNTVAFLAEPIQGEGGIVLPPKGWATKVREICTRRGIALIWDEVQTGFGRTGKMWAWQHEGAKPDLLCMGKALGGGIMPISACVGTAAVMDAVKAGEHGSTFGGSPFAMAIATESVNVLIEEKLPERGQELGDKAMKWLRDAKLPGVKDVRGLGLLIGVELEPRLGGAHALCEALLQNGVITKETRKHVIRLAPPLVIDEKDLFWGLEVFAKTVRELAAKAG